ncbi:hypothetical protein DUNSADRAFT_18570 [Dunaliella salina]|uniref:Encoded protein n=1 Tax=Dunaliella salina TaxID=3046 RepID=A0ABQ7GYZ0_DUNSA|nr:hypothetical protein DUNSADRAFT_18570 [Dunaliella salina]|eukprot:KAF5839807.1 hypothetical protein DUNSADRAFT_18570 [Dunaliella salina]
MSACTITRGRGGMRPRAKHEKGSHTCTIDIPSAICFLITNSHECTITRGSGGMRPKAKHEKGSHTCTIEAPSAICFLVTNSHECTHHNKRKKGNKTASQA